MIRLDEIRDIRALCIQLSVRVYSLVSEEMVPNDSEVAVIMVGRFL